MQLVTRLRLVTHTERLCLPNTRQSEFLRIKSSDHVNQGSDNAKADIPREPTRIASGPVSTELCLAPAVAVPEKRTGYKLAGVHSPMSTKIGITLTPLSLCV